MIAITGPELENLRRKAGLNQKQIAEATELDQSTISRMEKSPEVSIEDAKKYLAGVKTDDASRFVEHAESEWHDIAMPGYWHPNRADLLTIDRALAKIRSFLSRGNIPPNVSGQIEQYADSLRAVANYLLDPKHNIAFVGVISAGKTSALCVLANLVLRSLLAEELKDLRKRVVLDTGSGWVTLCEAQVSPSVSDGAAPYRFGLIIQPQSNEEVVRLVGDLCASTFENLHGGESEGRVSREMVRALKSMAGIMRKSMSVPDPLIELAEKCSSSAQLTQEFLGLMRCGERTECSLWHDAPDMESGLLWLQKVFADVNNGRNTHVPLPRRIDILVPAPLFEEVQLVISLNDTKGVDGSAVRTDIQAHLDNPRTLTVLCSRFAPEPAMLGVLEQLAKTGKASAIGERLVFLLLPRKDDVEGIKNEDGSPIASVEEAYSIRKADIRGELSNYAGTKHLPVLCFDADRDPKEPTVRDLLGKLKLMRKSQVDRALDLVAASDELMDNYSKAEVKQQRENAFAKVFNLLDSFKTLPAQTQQVHDGFMRAVRSNHPRRIWASVRRNGDYEYLNAYLHLSLGANVDAKVRSDPAFDALANLLDALMVDPAFEAVRSELVVLRGDVAARRERFLDEVRGRTKDMFLGGLFLDNKVWNECLAFWGPGFRDNVASTLSAWFRHEDQTWVHDAVKGFIVTKWEECFIGPLCRATASPSP